MGRDSRTSNLFRHADDVIEAAAASTIFEAGQDGDLMYGVQQGEVELRVGGQVVELVREGGFFGEMALIDKGPRSATAVARTDCKLVPIDGRRFEYLVQQTPFFAVEVLRTLSRRLRVTDNIITQ